MINKFRHIQYTDEGCDEYQCLSCYGKLEIRYINNWKFCPMCGIEFSGELECREHTTPSWLYKLDLDYHDQYELKKKLWKTKKSGWVIEYRDIWFNKSDSGEILYRHDHFASTDWAVYRDNRSINITAIEIFKHLKDLRFQSRIDYNILDYGVITEYRGRYVSN